jgi:hypothetical protein
MEDREWMYTSCVGMNDVTPEWIRKIDSFMEQTFDEVAKGASLVPYLRSKCANMKRKTKKVMVKHIWKNGFMPNYTRWIFHGEAHHTREEVVRQHVENYDEDDGGTRYVERLSCATVHRRTYGGRARANRKTWRRWFRREPVAVRGGSIKAKQLRVKDVVVESET